MSPSVGHKLVGAISRDVRPSVNRLIFRVWHDKTPSTTARLAVSDSDFWAGRIACPPKSTRWRNRVGGSKGMVLMEDNVYDYFYPFKCCRSYFYTIDPLLWIILLSRILCNYPLFMNNSAKLLLGLVQKSTYHWQNFSQ